MPTPLTDDEQEERLRGIPMFRDLRPEELRELLKVGQQLSLPSGREIFLQGDHADAMYVLLEGRVEVWRIGGDGTKRVATLLHANRCFGEFAILDDLKRTATVVTAEPCRVLRFPRDQMERLMLDDSIAAYKLVHGMGREVVRRLLEIQDHLERLT